MHANLLLLVAMIPFITAGKGGNKVDFWAPTVTFRGMGAWKKAVEEKRNAQTPPPSPLNAKKDMSSVKDASFAKDPSSAKDASWKNPYEMSLHLGDSTVSDDVSTEVIDVGASSSMGAQRGRFPATPPPMYPGSVSPSGLPRGIHPDAKSSSKRASPALSDAGTPSLPRGISPAELGRPNVRKDVSLKSKSDSAAYTPPVVPLSPLKAMSEGKAYPSRQPDVSSPMPMQPRLAAPSTQSLIMDTLRLRTSFYQERGIPNASAPYKCSTPDPKDRLHLCVLGRETPVPRAFLDQLLKEGFTVFAGHEDPFVSGLYPLVYETPWVIYEEGGKGIAGGKDMLWAAVTGSGCAKKELKSAKSPCLRLFGFLADAN